MPSTATIQSQHEIDEPGDQETDALVEAPQEHEISALAYRLWTERGCPIGSPEEDSFRAEQELIQAQKSV